MINNIDFERYKIFAEKQHLRLAPLTIIFGKNNTGKSAVLKLPLLIRSAMNSETNNVFTKKDASGMILCDEYRDVVYGKGNHAVKLQFGDEECEVFVEFIVENNAGTSHTKIETISIKTNEKNLEAHIDDDGDLRNVKNNELVVFSGLTPQKGEHREWIKSMYHKLEMMIDYIGPVRYVPKRYFELNELLEGISHLDGKNAYVDLVTDSQNTLHPMLDKVSDWYATNFGGWHLEVNNSRSPIYSIELSNGNLPNNNILDTGFGIQQSLPIVVAACKKYEKPVLIIVEEPESHLNPSAHADIGELLAMSVKADANKRFLVETHSLNFMVRLRTLIAKGELSQDDVALYYVDYDEQNSSSKLLEVSVLEDGEVKNWPENMFRETLQEALALRDAQMTRKL